MSDEKTNPPATDETLAETINPAIEAAADLGIVLRPITGHVTRRAESMDLDIDLLGADPDSIEDQDYYDDVMRACWLLSDDPENIRFAISTDGVEKALEVWKDSVLQTIAHESAAMKAFLARWAEYRVEMQKVFGEDS